MSEAMKRFATEFAAGVGLRFAKGKSFEIRRETALLVAALRGHSMESTEQWVGVLAQWAKRNMILKVPREPGKASCIQGRAVEFNCPAGKI